MAAATSVAVITPTIGTPALERCIRSVAAQTVPVMHVIVADGSEHHEKVCITVSRLRFKGLLTLDNHRLMQLPFNTGAGDMNGHRIYTALPYLLNCDWIVYLDEDNWFEPSHVEAMLSAASQAPAGTEWVHGLRRICSDGGEHLVNDECESIGLLHACWDRPNERFVDTNCLMVRRELACSVLPSLWNVPTVADRPVSAALVAGHRGATCKSHTVNYTIGEGHHSGVRQGYFLKGNTALGHRWADLPTLYVFHFTPQLTRALLEQQQRRPGCRAFDEWQMSQFDCLRGRFNLVDGFLNMQHIPPGSDCFVNWSEPGMLPWGIMKRRDVRKHTWLVESPNIRHTRQWDDELMHMFDTVFTFWKPMITPALPMCRFGRMNTHWLHLANPSHRAALVDNHVDDGSVVMVLQHRDLQGRFVIRDQLLTCLDPLREWYVKDLDDATVYGRGWDTAKDRLGPGVRIGHTLGNHRDPQSSVDILSGYCFALVVENVDADGYVGEKLYDCLVAGCIPLYYGNNDDDLVGVPRDLYVDLRAIPDSRALQAHLRGIDIPAFKQRIRDHRERVLQGVGAQYFADKVAAAIQEHRQPRAVP